MDFYDFKHKRREIAGEVENEMQRLFEGYKTVPENERYLFDLDEDPVRNCEIDRVNNIDKKDFNICYMQKTTFAMPQRT